MNVLKIIIVVGFGMILLACGGESKRSVKDAEEGMPKTEDGRIVLSSESEGFLVIPEGEAEDVVISSQKLGSAIANYFDSISEVFNISFESELYVMEVMHVFSPFTDDHSDTFTVSFDIRTTRGSVHKDVQCRARSNVYRFYLEECASGQVVMSLKRIKMRIDQIKVEGDVFKKN